jgi:hypothetical protein
MGGTLANRIRVSTEGKILIAVTALLALSLFLNFSPKEVAAPSVQPPVRIIPMPQDRFPDPIPDISLLKKDPAIFSGVKRNVFHFDEQGHVVETEMAQTSDQTAEVAGSQSTPASSAPDIHFVGLYREHKEQGAVLAALDSGGSILVGAVGQTLANQFQILEIHDDYVVVKVLSDQKIFRIPLGKAEPLQELSTPKVATSRMSD